jgi:hypothetical protein
MPAISQAAVRVERQASLVPEHQLVIAGMSGAQPVRVHARELGGAER